MVRCAVSVPSHARRDDGDGRGDVLELGGGDLVGDILAALPVERHGRREEFHRQ